jgi:hypothetical protein
MKAGASSVTFNFGGASAVIAFPDKSAPVENSTADEWATDDADKA